MKNSGVEWIGDIPEHWEIKKLKYIFNEINERSSTGNEELLSLSKYKGVIPKSSLAERAGMAQSLIGYKKVYKDTLVINKMQAVNGLLSVSKIEGITSPDYSIYSVKNNNFNINYYGYLLNQTIYLSEFKKVVTGVMEGFIRLYTDDLYNIYTYAPSKQEQQKIVDFIEEKTSKIDKAIDLQQQQITKLKEYKITLIDNVVTGKVRVV
jgi:type I restriction enzyme S subunit